MNLRVRILLGYGYLFALLLASAAGAAFGFHQLSQAIGLAAASSRSVQAATLLLEALERQDSALLSLLIGKQAARDDLAHAEKQFASALTTAKASLSIAGEAEVLAQIESDYQGFETARAKLLGATPERPLLTYETEIFPAFDRVKQEVFALIKLNHEHLERVGQQTQQSARLRAIVHALLVTVALFSLGFLSREMQRLVLDRLDELKAVAKAIAAGQRQRRVSVVREDELGFVARQLNTALDAQEEAEAEMRGRLAQQRQLLLALLEARGRPSIAITFSGELVASTLDGDETQEAMRVLAAARASGELETPKGGAKLRRKRFKLDAGERQLAVRLLEAPEERLVGWLASFEPKDDDHDDENEDQPTQRS